MVSDVGNGTISSTCVYLYRILDDEARTSFHVFRRVVRLRRIGEYPHQNENGMEPAKFYGEWYHEENRYVLFASLSSVNVALISSSRRPGDPREEPLSISSEIRST